MNRIGGALDYTRLAELNKPHDERAIAREVLVLAGRGLTERDIADTLRLDPSSVRRYLTEASNASTVI